LADAAITGALANVEINLASLKDTDFVRTTNKKVSQMGRS
jgi:formiminotetrahydrofolate cyclodeaminase